jgi:Zn finger protein HypA/HybF involved in hydrogenase expression
MKDAKCKNCNHTFNLSERQQEIVKSEYNAISEGKCPVCHSHNVDWNYSAINMDKKRKNKRKFSF